jgi:hypothetical protein
LDRTVNVFTLTLNDLAKTGRRREKELWEEAKKMNDKDDTGDYK